MKKLILIISCLFIFNNSAVALVEVDITRGNLDPLPIAVSPLYIESGSKDIKYNDTIIKNVGEEISKVIELNFRRSGLFNPLKKDGTVLRSEILDHARMNMPGQGFYKVLAESALRAIRICQPLRVPPTGYEKWKDLQLNFDANEMLKG